VVAYIILLAGVVTLTELTGSAIATNEANEAIASVKPVGGHPFMSPHGGGGGQAQMDACGRGRVVQPHVDVHTEN